MSAKTKLILGVALLLAVVAGWAGGMLASRQTSEPPRRRSRFEQLDLTAEQREKMHAVWESVSEFRRTYYQRRRELATRRDEAIAALFAAEQREAYEKILQDYQDGRDALSAEQTERVEQAVAKTKEFLTPEQAAKYDELRKSRGPRSRRFGGPRSRRRGSTGEDRERRGGTETRPTSQPTVP